MIAHRRTLIIRSERPESLSTESTLMETLWLSVVCWAVRAAGGTPSNLGKIGDLGSFLQIRYYFKTDKIVLQPLRMLTLSVLTNMLLLMKWVVWMTLHFISSHSAPWLIEFPLDIHVLKEMTLYLCYTLRLSNISMLPLQEVCSFMDCQEPERFFSQVVSRYVRVFSADPCRPLTPPSDHQPSSCTKTRTASPRGLAKLSINYSCFLRKHTVVHHFFSMKSTDWHL